MLEALVVALTVALIVVGERARRDRARHHHERLVATLLTTLEPVVALGEPRELLAWRSVARTARQLFPEAVAEIEHATGERFPFSQVVVQDAHARWTAEWLAWERQHDAEFKQRVRALEAELRGRGEERSPPSRARLVALDDEKLQTYQQRYEEYVRIGNGLAALEDEEGAKD